MHAIKNKRAPKIKRVNTVAEFLPTHAHRIQRRLIKVINVWRYPNLEIGLPRKVRARG